MRARDFLGKTGPLGQALVGYEERLEQLAMADAVEDALAKDATLLVEAGTGTGKTLAYLVPAMLSGRRVVISTGTKTLQDQIMHHDVPLLEAHLGSDVTVAAMKGLSNYLCLRRYEELVHGPEADKPAVARDLVALRAFRATTASGERGALAGVAEDAPIWGHVHSGPDTRIGQRCQYYEACFVTRMRRAADEARIIVVNHHLYFADLALRAEGGGGGVIPEHDAVIFDEAHQIEDVVTDFFGTRLGSAQIAALARDTERTFKAAALLGGAELSLAVMGGASAFFASLPRARENEGGRRPLPQEAWQGALEQAGFRLDAELEALAMQAKLEAAHSEPVAQISRRAQRMRDDLAKIMSPRGGAQVTWMEARGKTFAVGASPVDVADSLREQLFERAGAVILTSATLSTAQSFSFVRTRLGIDTAEELLLASPFDYGAHAALYLPPHLPDPRDPAFVEAAAREILALLEITGGGAFVLCTSLRMMERLADTCGRELAQKPLVQGTAPKAELLEVFRRRGNAVLFASASFWEGVDVPGDALRLVIIDKLPFEVPTDPLIRARCEALEAEGESAFMKYLVPSAALALKQGFGRLIRTARDRGVVAVLDPRLTHKGYGKVFLRSLPPASRCHSLDEVRAFWGHALEQLPLQSSR